MKDSNRANQPCNESSVVIEAHHNLKEKLDIAELILKTLNIKYQIKTPKTCASNLKNSLFRKSLNQVQDKFVNY
jgi:hypothetical protein